VEQEKKADIPDLKFEPLGDHDRAAFSCGNEALDNYIRKQASQDVKKKAAVVYVATLDSKTILGYYTLSQFSIHFNEIPADIAKKFSRYSAVSATLLGRLARHVSMKGKDFGELLLMHALHSALRMSEQIASAAIVTDAKDRKAEIFYKRYGFIELPKTEKRLFLPMVTVEALFPKSAEEAQK
jgi:predicted GNAT family N-acyltransferase